MNQKMYNLNEVADITGAQVRTVRYWVISGKLKATKVVNSQAYPWLVSENDLKKFMEDRKNGN